MPAEAGARLHRLHPASIVFHLLKVIWSVLGPILVALLLARRGQQLWVAALALPAALLAVLRYLAYGYRLDEHELVVRQGILTRQERHIPYAKIQNLHLIEGPLHRVWRVAEVRVETAAGTEPEAELRVLSLVTVATLRARVLAARARDDGAAAASPANDGGVAAGPAATVGAAAAGGGAAAPSPGAAAAPAAPLVSLSARDLVLAGLTRGRGALVVAAALGLVVQLDLVEWRAVADLARQVAARWRAALSLADHLTTLGLALATLLGLALMLRLLSVAWSLVKFHGFTLARDGDDLRAGYGLVTRVTASIPRQRIQLLTAESRPLHRIYQRLQVRVETAGGAAGAPTRATAQLWLAPILEQARLAELVAAALPGVAIAGVEWQPVAARARRRRLARSATVVGLGAAASVPLLGWWALPALAVALMVAAADAALYVKGAGWAVLPGAFLCRTGWWARRMSVVRLSKIQVVALRQSPLDQRFELAAVEVDTAGAGRLGQRVRVPYLDAAVAADLADRLATAASATAYRC